MMLTATDEKITSQYGIMVRAFVLDPRPNPNENKEIHFHLQEDGSLLSHHDGGESPLLFRSEKAARAYVGQFLSGMTDEIGIAEHKPGSDCWIPNWPREFKIPYDGKDYTNQQRGGVMKIYKWEIAAIIVGLAMIALGKTANAADPTISETEKGEAITYFHPQTGRPKTILWPPRIELDYSVKWCAEAHGLAPNEKRPAQKGVGGWEVAFKELDNTRADCIVQSDKQWLSIEFDRSSHYAESIGQSSVYTHAWRLRGNKRVRPGIILIQDNKTSDKAFLGHIDIVRRMVKSGYFSPQNRPVVLCMAVDGSIMGNLDTGCPKK